MGSVGLAALYDRFASFRPLEHGLEQHAQTWWAWASGISSGEASACGGCCGDSGERSGKSLP